MDIISSATKVEKDIEIYMHIRDLMHKIVKETLETSENEEELDLKDLKLKLDIADKSIQNRLRLLVHIGKLNIDLNDNEDLEKVTADFYSQKEV